MVWRAARQAVAAWNRRASEHWAWRPQREIEPLIFVFGFGWLGAACINVPIMAQILELYIPSTETTVLPYFGRIQVFALMLGLVFTAMRSACWPGRSTCGSPNPSTRVRAFGASKRRARPYRPCGAGSTP